MANKKNLPYIPLYTGDWEKDCNVLSLEAEAAWLRIIFKMFNNGKQSTYKISTKALQNLWRVDEVNMFCIVDELTDNEICGIEKEEKYIIFTSRRYEKENIISEKRKEAVSNRKDRTKTLQNTYKTFTKNIQNAENEIENENENEIKILNKRDEIKNLSKEYFNEVMESFSIWTDYLAKQHEVYLKDNEYTLGVLLDTLKRITPAKFKDSVEYSMSSTYKKIYERPKDRPTKIKEDVKPKAINDVWKDKLAKLNQGA